MSLNHRAEGRQRRRLKIAGAAFAAVALLIVAAGVTNITLPQNLTPTATHTEPSPSPRTSISSRTANSTATNTAPGGTAPISPQSASASPGTRPAGASDGFGSFVTPALLTGVTMNGDGRITDIVAMGSEDLFISFFKAGSGIMYAKTVTGGDSWSIDVVDAATLGTNATSIAAVDSSTVLIAYQDNKGDTTDANDDLKFAKSTNGGSTWAVSTVDSTGTGGHVSIAAADAATFFVSYFDFTGQDLMLAKSTNGGASWTTSTVDSAGIVGHHTSIAAVDSNTVYIAYSEHIDLSNGYLKFAKSTNGGASWAVSTIDSAGLVGQYASIAAISASTIFISYYDGTNRDLKFAKSSDGGASWTTATIDSAGIVGGFSGIAAVDANTVFISYHDETNWHLKFARSTNGGATWATSTVDSAANVGIYTSIAAADSDTVFISYYATSGSLKFANYIVPWYPGTFSADTDGDGFTDTVYFVTIDLDGDGDIDRIELSSDDNAFGETGNLTNQMTGVNDDERFDAGVGSSTSSDIALGAYLFTITFDHARSSAQSIVSVTANTWFTGSLLTDVSGDGTADTIFFALSDGDSDGVYEAVDYSLGNSTFGQSSGSSLTDLNIELVTDDERMTFGSNVSQLGYWKSDGSANATVGPNATLFGGSQFAAGRLGQAFNFDGVDDYATAGSSINLANSSFTIAFWARRNRNAQEYVVSLGTTSNNQLLHMGFRAGGSFTCAFFGNDLDTAATYSDTDWHHWACTFDAATRSRTIYRDGTIVASGTASANFTGSGVLNIGRHEHGPHYFGGAVDELRIYSSALSESNVASLASQANWTETIAYGTSDLRFRTAHDTAPALDANDVRVSSSTWYRGTLLADLDGNSVDETIDYVLIDHNSDGIYTVMELDADDSGGYASSEVHDSNNFATAIGDRAVAITFGESPSVPGSFVIRSGQTEPTLVLHESPEEATSESDLLYKETTEEERKELAQAKVPPAPKTPDPAAFIRSIDGQLLVSGEVIAVLAQDVPDPDIAIKRLARDNFAEIIGSIPETRTYQLQVSASSDDALATVIKRIESFRGIDGAAHHYLIETLGSRVPNDPLYGRFDVERQVSTTWGTDLINAPTAWETTVGSRQVQVAVIDADFDPMHADLKANIDRTQGGRTAAGGHGTHVAGTICAAGNNGAGFTGVAWECSLRLYDFGATSALLAQDMMVRAVDEGARVVNMSLQWVDNNQCGKLASSATLKKAHEINATLSPALRYAERNKRDVLWVFAAGNECRDSQYAAPASLVAQFPRNVITVAAIDPDGRLSDFSNRGTLVSVAAPGAYILSTKPRDCSKGCVETYAFDSGTSMAAPHVSGVAALMLAASPGITAARIKRCITGSAKVLVPVHNFRIVDAEAAVRCAAPQAQHSTPAAGHQPSAQTPPGATQPQAPAAQPATLPPPSPAGGTGGCGSPSDPC